MGANKKFGCCYMQDANWKPQDVEKDLLQHVMQWAKRSAARASRMRSRRCASPQQPAAKHAVRDQQDGCVLWLFFCCLCTSIVTRLLIFRSTLQRIDEGRFTNKEFKKENAPAGYYDTVDSDEGY